MKVKTNVPFKVCRRCPYNDYIRTKADYCIRAKCIYKAEEKEGEHERKENGPTAEI